MARPNKEGLDYFPLDIDIFEDEKIEAIAGEFGIKGELAVIKLLCAVYKKGYFIVWNDLTKATLLKRLPGVSKELLDQIVARLVAWEFFNEDLFNSAKVLTSENIQAVYFEAIKRRKSPKPTKYVINADINPQGAGVNDDINPQSKGNETKGNEIKQKQTIEPAEYAMTIYQVLETNGFGNPYAEPINTDLREWIEKLTTKGLSAEQIDQWLIAGVYVALRKNRKFWNFVDGVLRNWDNDAVYTLDAIEGEKARRKKPERPKLSYEQDDDEEPYF